ncbi:hypothetical protein COU61_02925, partial [Candidatus Pacearchaeota archaeon CG10_big_fil_rev_8_21_14_0_10_35_13]
MKDFIKHNLTDETYRILVKKFKKKNFEAKLKERFMLDSNVSRYEKAISASLRLIDDFEPLKLRVPGSIKGSLGEFLVAKQLLLKNPQGELLFFGGTCPGFDIIFNGKRIEVKTQDKYQTAREVRGIVADSCPTVSGKSIEKETFDFLVLVIINIQELNKTKFYVFSKEEVKEFFHKTGCWSGNDSENRTIFFIKSKDDKVTN